ncbi:hypothetical protein ACWDOR_12565 [Streptosporangium canum]|uniref:hypothetical protein n=1 Tax=Streptosporangium canum TaxID=324952 RepID=UPI003687F120
MPLLFYLSIFLPFLAVSIVALVTAKTPHERKQRLKGLTFGAGWLIVIVIIANSPLMPN